MQADDLRALMESPEMVEEVDAYYLAIVGGAIKPVLRKAMQEGIRLGWRLAEKAHKEATK